MKGRFTTIDLRVALNEIAKSDAIGLRVINIYDIDNKTYLIRVVHGEKKIMILVESGNRIHLTDYDWPKNMLPSSFSMKCRKHLKGRRLASVKQLGIDRIVDFQFGYDEAAYHLVVELYDRGNIILTDYEYTILQLLRMRTDTDKDVKFAVREQYPWNLARQYEPLLKEDELVEKLKSQKVGEQLKRVLNPLFVYGPALLEHCLLEVGLKANMKLGNQFQMDSSEDIDKLMKALTLAEEILQSTTSESFKGYIIQKKETLSKDGVTDTYLSYTEFHPLLYHQHETYPYVEVESFNKAVDEFFSKQESQKLDMKAIQQEKAALKRLENVKLDHEKRIESLQTSQDDVMRKAELIEVNLPLVERAIMTINSAIANQIDWEEIEEIVSEAKAQNDPVAKTIKSLNLELNKIDLLLSDPFAINDNDEGDSDDEDTVQKKNKKNQETFVNVEIDLALTAFANARSYHNKRRHAASKEQKTIQASKKALKSAEQKTQETLKEVQTSKLISKTRKTNWFEKFYWFISSENYLVIGGRDQQQNELIVKRYLKPGDLYVHADLHGASSVILKNPGGGEVPPKTLNEAGTMAICYSAAWEARVVTSAWWVYHNQVSKTAPSGEYLSTGSFMIRGKKNYLPPSYLVMGFSVLFKLDEPSIENHKNDRKVKMLGDDTTSETTENNEEIKLEDLDEDQNQNEIPIVNGESCENNENEDENDVNCENNEIDDNSNKKKTQESEKDFKNTDIESDDRVSLKKDIENNTEGINLEVNKPSLKTVAMLDNDNNDPKEITIKTENLDLTNNEKNNIENSLDNSDNSNKVSKETIEDIEASDDDYYPDTNIQLQHVTGGVFQLQRGISSTKPTENEVEGEDFVYLGDGEKIPTTKQQPVNRKPKLSAKQKRDLKKKKKQQLDEEENEEVNTEGPKTGEISPTSSEKPTTKSERKQPQQQPVKRGQRSKQKRMKEKYKDQDEEDRELMQQILRADEPEKPPKKKGKEKLKEKQKQPNKQKLSNKNSVPEILHNPNITPADEHKPQQQINEDEQEDEPNEDGDKENVSVLDSLTGCPISDDVLLYAVPICAPYTCMQNYKFKVKLTPGTGKRGKAAKTALHIFQMAKEVTDWEKDLMKCLKDVDISRNIPGKVKVSAPNLQRAKKK